MQEPMLNPEDIIDPTTAMNMALVLMAKAFKLNYSTPTNNNQRISSNPHNRQITQPECQESGSSECRSESRCSGGNHNGLIVVLGIANPNANQNGNGNVVAARAEGDLDEIEEVNANCILMANLQQASASGTQIDKAPVYDSYGSVEEAAKFVRDFKSLAKEADESLTKHKALEFEIKRLLRAVVNQDIMSIVQSNSVVDTSNFQTELVRTKERLENCIIKKEKEYVVLWNSNNKTRTLQQAQLGDLNGKSKDTLCESDTLDSLSQKLKNENVELEFQVDETNDLSNPVTSNSVPTPQESKVMKNATVISPRMFRINPFKTSREDKFVPINQAKASVRTNPITVSQPYVITKKHVNSDSNSLSSTGVDNTAKTRRPQHKRNIKNDKVPSASKSSFIKNKEVKVEEHHRNLLLSKNKKHMSSECNKVKLAIRNDKFEVICAMWSPTRRMFDLKGKIIESSESKSQSDCSKGTVSFGNDQVAVILGYGDIQLGNISITRVYFVEGLGHKLFSVGQFCDSDLEVAFRRNTCFIRNLDGVDLLKGNRITNLYTINIHEMASASLICLMARATSTKSWLWHQHLSHLNFDTINDLAKNDIVTGLLKFKYHKEHLCPSCEHGKSKKASHPPKHVPNSKQRLHLLHMDLCGPMRVESINVLLQALVIIVRTDNGTEFMNQVLKEYFDSVGISHQASSNDREDIGKLGAKGDIGFFIGYSTTSCAYRVYNRRTKKIMETMNVTFDELSAMAFEQRSSKPRLQSMYSGQISSVLDLTYAPSTITTQQPTERELDLLFKALYDDYIGGQLLATTRTAPAAQAPQDHPLEQVIGEPSRPLLTRNQLRIDGDMCTYALTVSTIEPRNVKEAMNDPSWIESMQEELLQLKRLDVWVLVPAPDNIKPVTLK
ncbi:retrovirus-related pol polyprotein from transposon TNT 1-94 [Tanacetum coccineum]